ncbi:yippee family zinc-binding protein, putative [Medicago truncatula]|uniref:Protein yippee-like n=1 Tax=Medicago truncatula TaxID=3880 RepID=A0A072UNQ9_MEDTR|nr:yippee family zinc-binding protein, putative [Medicago truncatula]
MGRVFYLDLDGRAYRCTFCRTPFALADHVLSRSFSCSRGRAYLFSKVVNVTLGTQVERLMMSGLHTVEDIFCCCCGQIVGWKYVSFTFSPLVSLILLVTLRGYHHSSTPLRGYHHASC